ncbi:MAG: class I SAM-dependent methyltransferase [Ardenticatenaceae bacterium]|nr:class I SAM-dependent methyltransferase [Ardenticatenaceae bacterium]MCB9442935.1 class I SAM-dependent methyltransferase [Ardenticatenaceae bacterium]
MAARTESVNPKKWLNAFLGVVGVTAVLTAILRLQSRRQSLPCPAWLTVLLENPYMNSVAGADKILDRMALEPGMKVLDVGCGPGRLTIPAARRVGPTGTVTALDIQPEMLHRLQDRIVTQGLTNIQTIQAGAGEGKMPVNTFDRAMLVTVLGEIPDRQKALTEIFAALKPNGVLSITEALPDPHYQSPTQLQKLTQAAGFKEQSCTGSWVAFTMNFVKPGGQAS